MTDARRRMLGIGLCIVIVAAAAASYRANDVEADYQVNYRRDLERSLARARDLDVACAKQSDCEPSTLRDDKAKLAAELTQTRTDLERSISVAKLATGAATIVIAVAALLFLWLVTSPRRRDEAEPQPDAGATAMEETLRDRLEQLYAERSRARDNARFAAYGEIAAGLSHGLKTPLSSIRANVQLIQAKIDPDHNAHDSLDEMLDQVDELVGQINRFLATMGSGEPATSRSTVANLLVPLDERYSRGDAKRRISFETEIADDLPEVTADSELVEMALRNLIDNALYFARDGTTVTLAASACSSPRAVGLDRKPPPPELAGVDWVELAVIDAGRGISMEIADGKEGESSRPGGSGLGVAIARRVAARHGGTLLIDAVADKGTCARFILPPAISDTDAGA